MANLIVLIRVSIIFIALLLLNSASFTYRITGLVLLLFSVLLDGLDGYIARKFNSVTKAGGLLDTLGDRITENVMMIFLAYRKLIPFEIAVFFVTRSFMADFIRTLNFSKGIGTFQNNSSFLGRIFVSSVISRILYLLSKLALFIGGCLVYIFESASWHVLFFKSFVWYGSFCVLAFSLIRFVLLIYDSRQVIAEYF